MIGRRFPCSGWPTPCGPARQRLARYGSAGLAIAAGLALATGLAVVDKTTRADEPAGGLVARPWKLEAIEFEDGRRLEGLVVAPDNVAGTPSHDAADIEFVQVVRPPGRPMHLVAWPAFGAASVRFVDRLVPQEREILRERVEAFRKGRRRQDEVAAVPLVRQGQAGPWRYDSADFQLLSTADPSLTREAVVRLHLAFDALATLVPPVGPAAPVAVRLCGSLAEYQEIQATLGLRLENPAFFVPAKRLLVAGSELPALLEERRTADDLLEQARQRHLALTAGLDHQLRRLASDLESLGKSPQERSEIVKRARGRAARELEENQKQIEAAKRANTAVVETARRLFFERLSHEAWHAYADGRLRLTGAAGLPAWLDEGLAQVLETAPLEAGELRLDAPDPRRLARLQQAIAANALPPIADVIAGGQEAFLGRHGGDNGLAYLTAWGLALDLAVIRPVLSPPRIRAFTTAGDAAAVAGFETLVGMPIDRYDRQWRQRILDLRGPAVSGPP